MRELVEEIHSHTKVINLDNPTTRDAAKGQEQPASLHNPSPLVTADIATASPDHAQDPNT